MKKTKITLLILLTLITFNFAYSQRTTFQCSFAKLEEGQYIPITNLTVDSLRLVCVYGTYNGYVIYPDNVNTPYFVNDGNGQYTLGWFNGGNFLLPDKKYEVVLQRKINGSWIEQTAFGYFWIGDFGENIDLKLDKSDTSNSVRVYGNQNIYGNKTFYGTNSGTNWTFSNITVPTMNNGTIIYETGANRLFLGSYTYGTPILMGTPRYNNSAVYKSWVQSEIQLAIQGVLNGNYIESPNIVRLMPNGTISTGKTYTSWGEVSAYASSFVAYNKQLTALICGEGTSATYIIPSLYNIGNDTSAYFIPYTNYRGLGSGVIIIMDGNFYEPQQRFMADTLGQIIIEDINFYFDNESQTGEIKNIIFKNCSFYSTGGFLTFTNCRFEGYNYFNSTIDNAYTFINCIGTNIFSQKDVVATGTNILNVQTPTKLFIKSKYFYYGLVGAESEYGIRTERMGIDSLMEFKAGAELKLNTDSRITLSTNEFNCTDGLTDTILFVGEGGKTHTIIIIKGLIKSWNISE